MWTFISVGTFTPLVHLDPLFDTLFPALFFHLAPPVLSPHASTFLNDWFNQVPVFFIYPTFLIVFLPGEFSDALGEGSVGFFFFSNPESVSLARFVPPPTTANSLSSLSFFGDSSTIFQHCLKSFFRNCSLLFPDGLPGSFCISSHHGSGPVIGLVVSYDFDKSPPNMQLEVSLFFF